MVDITLLGVAGSLQARSSNRSLLDRLPALAPPAVRVELFDGNRALPLFDLDQLGPLARAHLGL